MHQYIVPQSMKGWQSSWPSLEILTNFLEGEGWSSATCLSEYGLKQQRDPHSCEIRQNWTQNCFCSSSSRNYGDNEQWERHGSNRRTVHLGIATSQMYFNIRKSCELRTIHNRVSMEIPVVTRWHNNSNLYCQTFSLWSCIIMDIGWIKTKYMTKMVRTDR